MGVANVTVTRFLKFGPIHIFGIGEVRHFKYRVLIDTEEYSCMHYRLPSGSRDLLAVSRRRVTSRSLDGQMTPARDK